MRRQAHKGVLGNRAVMTYGKAMFAEAIPTALRIRAAGGG